MGVSIEMIARFMGLVRDAWWLMLMVLVGAIVSWIFVSPIVGVAMFLVAIPSFFYFSMLRYDDQGRERKDV